MMNKPLTAVFFPISVIPFFQTSYTPEIDDADVSSKMEVIKVLNQKCIYKGLSLQLLEKVEQTDIVQCRILLLQIRQLLPRLRLGLPDQLHRISPALELLDCFCATLVLFEDRVQIMMIREFEKTMTGSYKNYFIGSSYLEELTDVIEQFGSYLRTNFDYFEYFCSKEKCREIAGTAAMNDMRSMLLTITGLVATLKETISLLAQITVQISHYEALAVFNQS
jgi:hypothetical protein